MPKFFQFWDHRFLMKHFELRGWEFGEWVTQEDRMNYVAATGISLYDMRQILGFKAKDMGLAGKITMAIGARGVSAASAHFEPFSFAINLTRYKGKPGPSKVRYSPWLKRLREAPKALRFCWRYSRKELCRSSSCWFPPERTSTRTDSCITRSRKTCPNL